MKPRSYGQGSLGLWRLTGAKAATIVTVAMKSGEPAIGGSQLRRRGTLCTQFASWTNVFRIAKVDLREQDREEQESPPCKSLHRSPKAHAGFILTCFRAGSRTMPIRDAAHCRDHKSTLRYHRAADASVRTSEHVP